MNIKVVMRFVGRVVAMEAALLLIPLFVALAYGESVMGFLAAIAAATVVSTLMILLSKTEDKTLLAKEGFCIVALTWIFISLIGAIPFVVEGAIPHYIDAVFETVSGFTTTGSTILTDVEALGKGLLFWRSFTHWIGGMGILVLMMALLPMSKKNSMYVMRAEVPGPDAGKLVPKVQHSSLILYLIYIGLTLLEIILLVIGRMPLYDAVVHAFGTAGTGGFSIRNLSIGYYDSVYIDVVIGIFMLLFGINFNLYFFALMRRFSLAVRNTELYCYLGIAVISTIAITWNIMPQYGGDFLTGLRYSFFQVSSYMTTTGFCTADANAWPMFSRGLLMILMFIGACAGSTGGGMKVSRIVILFRALRSELKHLLRPRSFNDGKDVNKEMLRGTLVFFFTYIAAMFVGCLIISFENYDFETTFSSVLTCLSNIGPRFGGLEPLGTFAMFSWPSKIVLTLCMLLGRLELFPILLLAAPKTWRKSSRF